MVLSTCSHDCRHSASSGAHHPVSASTIGRWLHDAGLHACTPLTLLMKGQTVMKLLRMVASSSVKSPACLLTETANEYVCGGAMVSAKMNGLLSCATRPRALLSSTLYSHRQVCRKCGRMFKLPKIITGHHKETFQLHAVSKHGGPMSY